MLAGLRHRSAVVLSTYHHTFRKKSIALLAANHSYMFKKQDMNPSRASTAALTECNLSGTSRHRSAEAPGWGQPAPSPCCVVMFLSRRQSPGPRFEYAAQIAPTCLCQTHQVQLAAMGSWSSFSVNTSAALSVVLLGIGRVFRLAAGTAISRSTPPCRSRRQPSRQLSPPHRRPSQ